MPTYRNTPEAVSKFTPEQYRETQTDRIERSLFQRILGQHRVWSLRPSSEPLFACFEKLDSETGWPSFTETACARESLK